MSWATLSAPVTIEIEMTSECNNRCDHCYRGSNLPATNPSMRLDDLDKILADAASAGVMTVVLTGGEPLMTPDLVAFGVRVCADLGLRCHLNTNLTLMSDALAVRLAKAGPVRVLTSLAGAEPAIHDVAMGRPGAFEDTMRGIAATRAAGLPFSVNMVVTADNLNAVYETGLLAHALGAVSFSATKAGQGAWQPGTVTMSLSRSQVRASLDSLIRVRESTGMPVDVLECYPHCLLGDLQKYRDFARRSCTAGVTSVAIGPDGTVRACTHTSQHYGNAATEGLRAAYGRMHAWREGAYIPATCKTCQLLNKCSAGCRADAEARGDITGMDPVATRPPRATRNWFQADRQLEDGDLVAALPGARIRTEGAAATIVSNGSVVRVDAEAADLFRRLQRGPVALCEIDRDAESISATRAVIVGFVRRGIVRVDTMRDRGLAQ